jgi:hypothetical protein
MHEHFTEGYRLKVSFGGVGEATRMTLTMNFFLYHEDGEFIMPSDALEAYLSLFAPWECACASLGIAQALREPTSSAQPLPPPLSTLGDFLLTIEIFDLDSEKTLLGYHPAELAVSGAVSNLEGGYIRLEHPWWVEGSAPSELLLNDHGMRVLISRRDGQTIQLLETTDCDYDSDEEGRLERLFYSSHDLPQREPLGTRLQTGNGHFSEIFVISASVQPGDLSVFFECGHEDMSDQMNQVQWLTFIEHMAPWPPMPQGQ